MERKSKISRINPPLEMKSNWDIIRRRLKYARWDKPMPRPDRFDIEFDAPGEIYFPEQVVTGNVILKITQPLNLKGVKIRFKGECSIHFIETKKLLRRIPRKKKNKVVSHDSQRIELQETKTSINYPKNSKIWPTEPNGNYTGVENPGYTPEAATRLDWEKEQSGEIPTQNGVHDPVHRRPLSSKVTRVANRPLSAAFSQGGLSIIDGPTHHYQAMETYFDCEFYIYGHKYQKEEKEMLPAGLHTFPFAFNLPPNLPPSFSSEHGIIRYMVAAVLDRPTAANLVRKAGFSIHTLLDLNIDSHAAFGVNRSKAINPCGLCWDTGPITLSISIPRRGYVPGEYINVQAEVDNISGRNTKGTTLTLSQILTFTMPNDVKTHVEERKVKEIVRGTLAPGDSDFWEDINIHIPPVAPNNLHFTCRLLELQYKLEMIVELPRPWKDLRVCIPITIGSVPLRANFDSFLPSLDPKEKYMVPPGIKYPDYPNYSLGKCIFDNETLEGQYERLTGDKEYMGFPYADQTPFAPTYLVYPSGNNVSRSTTCTSTDTGKSSFVRS